MDIFNALKTAATVAASFIPGAAPVMAAVNAFLPEGEKLPETATGQEVLDAYEKLPADAQVKIKEIAATVKIAEVESDTTKYVAMTKADGHSTRPAIARQMSLTLCGVILIFTYGFATKAMDSDGVTWEVFGMLVGTPAAILLRYFGVLVKEQGQRLGLENKGVLGMVGNLIKSKIGG